MSKDENVKPKLTTITVTNDENGFHLECELDEIPKVVVEQAINNVAEMVMHKITSENVDENMLKLVRHYRWWNKYFCIANMCLLGIIVYMILTR